MIPNQINQVSNSKIFTVSIRELAIRFISSSWRKVTLNSHFVLQTRTDATPCCHKNTRTQYPRHFLLTTEQNCFYHSNTKHQKVPNNITKKKLSILIFNDNQIQGVFIFKSFRTFLNKEHGWIPPSLMTSLA